MYMRYRTEYPHAYQDGVVTKSITLSRSALDLMNENEIDNQSAFINDLIIDALQDKDFFKKKLLAAINTERDRLEKTYGIITTFDVVHK